MDEEVRRAHGFHTLSVKRVLEETHDTRSYALEVPEDLADIFRYQAGQFCTFRVHLGGEEHLRSYSMSSEPEVDPDLVVTVKRVPGGLVSNWFHDTVFEGTVLEVTRPAGVFCPRAGAAEVVAFCGGSGVTPVMSIAKSLLQHTQRRVKILYANRDRDSVIFAEALRALAARHAGRLEVRNHFDCDSGYLTTHAISRFAERTPDADFYICGPWPFMDLIEKTLLDLGVGSERILIERFETGETPASPLRDVGDTHSEVPDSVTLVLNGKSTTVSYRAGDTVLETARRAGLQPPFSCEAGNCATCMAVLRGGSVTMRANNALSPDEVEEGWILTCQAVPSGRSVAVEYEAL